MKQNAFSAQENKTKNQYQKENKTILKHLKTKQHTSK